MARDVYSLSSEEVCKELGTDLQNGLSSEEVLLRLEKFGKNELPPAKRFSAWIIFFRQFSSPLIWFLLVGALVAGFLGEWVQMSAIGAILVLNAIISFFQEYSAEKSFEALKSLYVVISRVIRDGQMREIPSSEIVPGDLIILEAGDQVPADGRLTHVTQLGIQEAALTGESTAVHKETAPLSGKQALADQKNMVFSGTQVTAGRGTFIVTKTGLETEFGKIAASLQEQTKEITPLQVRFNRLGKQLVLICIGIIIVIAILGFSKGMGTVEIALIALSLAVAAIPEGLPAIVTITLAMGVRKMAKNKALVRRLVSVETLGCTSVICSDKTGTLTKNEMVVLHVWVKGKRFDIHPRDAIDAEKDLLLALKVGVLCNHAELNQEWKISGDPTEGALLVAAAKAGLWKKPLELEAPFSEEIPFDSERKMMSILRKDGVLYAKGALESILPLCDEKDKDAIFKAQLELASQGFRVLALATKKVPKDTKIDPSLENNLEFVGLVAMMDPPREGVREAITACREAGITPVMITGDHKETATFIAKDIGLMTESSIAVEGKELDEMDDEALKSTVLKTAIFARVSAEHKLRIIEAWKSHGHVVAMTGDGVNDAPAIKKADIGIAMGITGTEVTKQASDMVILDDHFATIVKAVKEGRAIYSNIIRFVRFLLSANFAELLVILCGMLWGFSSVDGEVWAILLPAQILWINLVTDGLPSIALAFDPVEKQVMQQKPRKLTEAILSPSWILRLVLIGVVAAIGSLFAAHIGFLKGKATGQTMVFTELVILELGILFLIRMPLRVFSNMWIIGSVALSIVLQLLVLYFPPMHLAFGTSFLGLGEWLWIVSIACVANFLIFLMLKLMRRQSVV